VAIAGAEDPAIVAELAGLLGPDGTSLEVTLLHVVDSGPRGLLPIGPGRAGDSGPRLPVRWTKARRP
jgi:hypothetical protein